MANKINQEQSISRVYQFLSEDTQWFEKADKNGNGMLEKSEFRSYLLGSSLMWNGETSKEKDDLIDKFWKTVDTKTAGKMTNGSKTYSNKYSLDANEMKAMQDNVEAQNRIDTFMSSVKAPESLEAEFQFKLIKSVKESLINKAVQALKKGSVDDITQEWLEKAFKVSAAKATADYTALTVKNEKADSLPENYSIEDDDVLNKVIIKNYIASLENNPKDDATVAREIRELVEAYFDTANTNSQESIDKLAQYGYSNYNSLNPLQAETIKSNVEKEILTYIEENYKDIYTDEYKAQIKAMVDDFATSYIAGKGANQFNSLKSFDISEFAKSDKFKNLIQDIKNKQNELELAKDLLYKDVQDALEDGAEDREASTRAVSEIVEANKTNEITDIKKLIYSKTTIAEVDALRKEIFDKINKIKGDIADEIAANEAKYKARFSNLAGNIDDIENNNISEMTKSKSAIHTEFGMDANGNIVFEQNDTTEVYNSVVDTLIRELKAKNKEAFDAIGETNIKKLIQASWIAAYNTFSSADSNPTARFVSEVLNQFKKILNKLSEHPEYLSVYTSHTAYANSSLTSNLLYYGTEDTFGGDARWSYSGYSSIASDGGVVWESAEDADEYYTVMKQLLTNIKKSSAYKDIDENLITNVFRQAQDLALKTCVNNKQDCPYGTTFKVDNSFYEFGLGSTRNEGINPNSPVATAGQDWSGTNREGDRSRISPKALIELTLYYFDKLLYSKLAE